MKSSSLLLLFLTLAISTCSIERPVYGDMGAIPPSGSDVFEPLQVAIASWNGTVEMLILSHLPLSNSTFQLLEIIPLPSEPIDVRAGNISIFDRALGVVNAHLGYSGFYLGFGDKLEVIFQDRVGAHDVAVVRVNSASALLNWAQSYIAEKGVEADFASSELVSLIDFYISIGFDYIAFSIVEVTEAGKLVEPIIYTFESSFLYYPLRVSSLFHGVSNVFLLTLTQAQFDAGDVPQAMTLSDWFGNKTYQLRLSKDELGNIDPELMKMFPDGAWFSAIYYYGTLDALTADIVIHGVQAYDFEISVSPNQRTMVPGTLVEVELTTVIIEPVKESGQSIINCTLSCSGMPQGVSIRFNPNPVNVTGGKSATSVMSGTVDYSAPQGTYNLTITGSTPTSTRSTAFELEIKSIYPGQVPGYPPVSILIGIAVGVIALMVVRRKRGPALRAL